MAQWWAIVYINGPQVGEVRSYGTVVTDPLDTTKYEAIAVDGPPGIDEEWDIATKTIVPKAPVPPTRRQELKAKPVLTPQERDEVLQLLL